jgi:hypothetical protein
MVVNVENPVELPDMMPQAHETPAVPAEHESLAVPESHDSLVAPPAEADAADPEVMSDREVLLQMLLDPADYAYVKEHKLDELFLDDKETGQDGLRHILVGELSGDARIPKGFHHRPSADKLSLEDDEGNLLTRVEQVIDNKGNPTERPPMAPYMAHVAVDGKEKEVLRRVSKEESEITRSINSMFPDEYDALMVMRSIDQAMKNSDPAKDRIVTLRNGRTYYNLTGTVPMIDGKSEMAINVSVDYDTLKVVTAFPALKLSDTMQLTEKEVAHHTTYGLASAAGNVAVKAGESL